MSPLVVAQLFCFINLFIPYFFYLRACPKLSYYYLPCSVCVWLFITYGCGVLTLCQPSTNSSTGDTNRAQLNRHWIVNFINSQVKGLLRSHEMRTTLLHCIYAKLIVTVCCNPFDVCCTTLREGAKFPRHKSQPETRPSEHLNRKKLFFIRFSNSHVCKKKLGNVLWTQWVTGESGSGSRWRRSVPFILLVTTTLTSHFAFYFPT